MTQLAYDLPTGDPEVDFARLLTRTAKAVFDKPYPVRDSADRQVLVTVEFACDPQAPADEFMGLFLRNAFRAAAEVRALNIGEGSE